MAEGNIGVAAPSSAALFGYKDADGNLQPAGATTPFPVVASAAPTFTVVTDRSGAIAAGATSQQLMAANADRKYLLIQNKSTAALQNIAAAESLVIRLGATAATLTGNDSSFEILPGGHYEPDIVPTVAIQVIATTIAHRWSSTEGT